MTKTADVVLDTQISTLWGNEIRDRSIQVVASTAERDTSFPGPVKGQSIYIASGDANEGLYTWDGTAWRLPWNMPWGQWYYGTTNLNPTTATPGNEITLYSITIPLVNNRRYLVHFTVYAGAVAQAFGKDAYLGVQDFPGGNRYYASGPVGPNTSNNYPLYGFAVDNWQGGTGPRTWNVRAGCGLAAAAVSFSNVTYVNFTDIGPVPGSGAPA